MKNDTNRFNVAIRLDGYVRVTAKEQGSAEDAVIEMLERHRRELQVLLNTTSPMEFDVYADQEGV